MKISRKESANNYIIRGSLSMDKRFFTKESMKAGSYLRMLLGLEETYCKKVVRMEKQDQRVVIQYGYGELVFVPNDVQGFFKKVKEAYGNNLKGNVDVSISYGLVDFLEIKVAL